MTYVRNYQHDIFVSYAHVDDEPLPGVQKGWVSTLVGCIKTRLAQRLGRSDAYSLWMDYELARHVKLTPQIIDALRQTAIMIVILSPGYLASEWCKRERNTFLELVEESSSRVFIIERDIVEPQERPSAFHDLMGFRFWIRDREGKPPRISSGRSASALASMPSTCRSMRRPPTARWSGEVVDRSGSVEHRALAFADVFGDDLQHEALSLRGDDEVA